MVVTSGLSSGWPVDSARVMTVLPGGHGRKEVRDRADGLEVWTRSTSLGVWQDWVLISMSQSGATRPSGATDGTTIGRASCRESTMVETSGVSRGWARNNG